MKSLLVQYWLVHLPNSRRSGFKSLTGIVMGVKREFRMASSATCMHTVYMKQMGCRISTAYDLHLNLNLFDRFIKNMHIKTVECYILFENCIAFELFFCLDQEASYYKAMSDYK